MPKPPILPETDPALLEALQAKASADGFIELPDFINTALYQPKLGYYRQDRERVGRSPRSDFFTSTSLRDAFGEIVLEASISLLGSAGIEASSVTWVEIGAEPDRALFDGVETPFGETATLLLGDTLNIPEKAVVFSNELFDAQPFRQIRRKRDGWREYGVRIVKGALQWAPRSELSPEAAVYVSAIESECPEGFVVDLPTGSLSLARAILSQPWAGVFIAFDYGKTWQALLQDAPQGTARAYFQHQQMPNILAAPGQIDVTHHICWDHLETELANQGFERVALQTQESFIVNRAPTFLQKAFDPSRASLDPIRSKLRELIHPALMGQKFQALTAVRHETPRL